MTSIGLSSHRQRRQPAHAATGVLLRLGVALAILLAGALAWWSMAAWLADSLIASMLVGVVFVTLAPLLGASHAHHR